MSLVYIHPTYPIPTAPQLSLPTPFPLLPQVAQQQLSRRGGGGGRVGRAPQSVGRGELRRLSTNALSRRGLRGESYGGLALSLLRQRPPLGKGKGGGGGAGCRRRRRRQQRVRHTTSLPLRLLRSALAYAPSLHQSILRKGAKRRVANGVGGGRKGLDLRV